MCILSILSRTVYHLGIIHNKDTCTVTMTVPRSCWPKIKSRKQLPNSVGIGIFNKFGRLGLKE